MGEIRSRENPKVENAPRNERAAFEKIRKHADKCARRRLIRELLDRVHVLVYFFSESKWVQNLVTIFNMQVDSNQKDTRVEL